MNILRIQSIYSSFKSTSAKRSNFILELFFFYEMRLKIRRCLKSTGSPITTPTSCFFSNKSPYWLFYIRYAISNTYFFYGFVFYSFEFSFSIELNLQYFASPLWMPPNTLSPHLLILPPIIWSTQHIDKDTYGYEVELFVHGSVFCIT